MSSTESDFEKRAQEEAYRNCCDIPYDAFLSGASWARQESLRDGFEMAIAEILNHPNDTPVNSNPVEWALWLSKRAPKLTERNEGQ